MTAQSNYLAGKRTEIHPYKTREGGATVTVFVPYNCLNNCPFCINKSGNMKILKDFRQIKFVRASRRYGCHYPLIVILSLRGESPLRI